MTLRKLNLKDILYMLEWMHDISVTKDLQTNFSEKTADDCKKFIINSWKMDNNIHLAIVNDFDEYQGTVSLKNIKNGNAEFAITIRASAMGHGFSKFAMDEIIHKGFEELGLNTIYWCVSEKNKRAIRFYDKNNYNRISPSEIEIRGKYNKKQVQSYIWYLITKTEKKMKSPV